MYLNGEDKEHNLSFSFSVFRNFPIQVKLKVSLIDKYNVERYPCQFDKVFNIKSLECIEKIISRNDILDPEKALLNDGTLTISVQVN